MRAPSEVLGTTENPCVAELRRAYRGLARRWHPDRFPHGPERDWASEKMTEINSAYCALIKTARAKSQGDAETLSRAREMIDDGRLTTARALLMTMPTRTAEWNYLFGALLMKLADYN
ncbi:MAG: J domain-containing protein, partial [Christensenellales bacterium]